jgi:signal transduction histidine kinase
MNVETVNESPLTIAALRNVQVLADLPEETLQWLIEHVSVTDYAPGQVVQNSGDPAVSLHFYVDGEVHFQRPNDSEAGMMWRLIGGDVSGKIPFSRMTVYPGTGRAVAPTRIASLAEKYFPELPIVSTALTQRLVWQLIDRAREAVRVDEQQERMYSLGKLSAGLAHELNNPAAASVRASQSLKHCATVIRKLNGKLDSMELSKDQRFAINRFEEELLSRLTQSEPLDALDQADLQDALEARLRERGGVKAAEAAVALAEARVTVAELDQFFQEIPTCAVEATAMRAATTIRLEQLSREVEAASQRITDLVGAIKEYSYMDQTPLQEVDVHSGIESTLRILNHKLRHGVKLHRRFSDKLPKINAIGTQLNQVWTNLIDNAIDAMDGKGQLTIETKLQNEQVLVSIEDSGKGIPEEILGRIFEPFFTTKGVGKGTGLGLDMVRKIVVRHHGTLDVQSEPGRTVIEVRLPVDGVPSMGPAQAQSNPVTISSGTAEGESGHGTRTDYARTIR